MIRFEKKMRKGEDGSLLVEMVGLSSTIDCLEGNGGRTEFLKRLSIF